MRSFRSKTDPLDPGPKGFAHRGLHYGAFPENSLIAFAAALELGAGIECDLRLTADNAIVIFHDADARRLCASSIQIGKSTHAQLARLSIGGQPLPTLESLFTLIKGRVPLLLEVKTDDDIWRWMPALKRTLAGYDGPFGVMSFDARIPRLLKTNLPEVKRGLVIRGDLSAPRRRLAVWLANPDFIAVDRSTLGQPWVSRLRHRIPVYSWTIRSPSDRETGEVHADALIWEGDGRPGA